MGGDDKFNTVETLDPFPTDCFVFPFLLRKKLKFVGTIKPKVTKQESPTNETVSVRSV